MQAAEFSKYWEHVLTLWRVPSLLFNGSSAAARFVVQTRGNSAANFLIDAGHANIEDIKQKQASNRSNILNRCLNLSPDFSALKIMYSPFLFVTVAGSFSPSFDGREDDKEKETRTHAKAKSQLKKKLFDWLSDLPINLNIGKTKPTFPDRLFQVARKSPESQLSGSFHSPANRFSRRT